MGRSKEVDAWFGRYDNPMKEVVERIRDIVLAADGGAKWRGTSAAKRPTGKKRTR
jgi:hypothetical protein